MTTSAAPPARSDQAAGSSSNDDVQYQYVQEPDKDFVRNEYLDGFNVGTPGRALLQKIYVRTPKGKLTTIPYNPKNDAPPDNRTVSILPTSEELKGGLETTLFLVVGLILAKEPDIYTKAADAKRTIPTPSNLLRVVTPLTEYISSASSKYYVACQPIHGLCQLRRIKINTTFVFAEIWDKISHTAPIKTRRTDLGLNIKRFAAKIQQPEQRAQRQISEGGAKCPGLTVTREENDSNLILMQFSLWQVTESQEALKALGTTVTNLLPDILKRPSNEGTAAFYDFSQKLTEVEAEQLITEVKASYLHICPLDKDLILALHDALCKSKTGEDLPYQSLALFLGLAHDLAGPTWREEICVMEDRLMQVNRQVMKTINIVNKTEYVSPVWTSSNQSGDRADPLVFMTSIHRALEGIKKFLAKQAVNLREQHGGLQGHSSLEELMTKIGNCVDRTALMALEEQVFAIHAEQLATSNSDGAGYIQELIDAMEIYLKAAPDSKAWGQK